MQRLDALPEGETGRLLFQVDGKDAAGEPIAQELSKASDGQDGAGFGGAGGGDSRHDRMGRRWRAGFG